MAYRSMTACVTDLAAHGHLVRIDEEVDPNLEAAEIHRRVFDAGGPAIYYARVKGSPFPMVSNLFGTIERARFIFRDTLERVRRLIELKVDPAAFWRQPSSFLGVPRAALGMLPRYVRGGPILHGETNIDQLPQQVSWPDDGGAFVTLPQVYTEDVRRPGLANSNLGMYRIQLSGNEYEANREIGLHYQLHRGIGVHQTAALERGEPFRVNIFVGGPPAMNVAAVMPLPEGFSELRFAGALAGRRVRMIRRSDSLPLAADADFCICGTVIPDKMLPEGPFGDHLGYYSLAHDFPVLRVEHVYHRRDAVWPFTVVGRPPQEDTIFGQLIHDLTGPVIPTVIPGVRAVHAVDAAGVHPLLLAIGSERYVPFAETTRPQELLTQANAILGQGQLSLAKYLWITAEERESPLDIHDIPAFFQHILRRVDWRRDVHFQTKTTIDTLDYSGSGLNEGSKVVIAAVGQPQRELPHSLPGGFTLPSGFADSRVVFPGVLAVRGPAAAEVTSLDAFCGHFDAGGVGGFPLVVVVDDAEFTAAGERNFLWVTFTRSNPAADIYGTRANIHEKHWGCQGSLVIDARVKPHHAPAMVPDAEVARRVERLAAAGGPLAGII
ncbi:MAG: UbiD family decarboxylase [Planctomycetota bacterium]|nr:MAG: UbiD family decarboxylase [Planctomycetota bacterium]